MSTIRNQNNEKSRSQITFGMLLTLLLIGLKLGGIIDWWWIWIILPAFIL